jgi:hypothetical protein
MDDDREHGQSSRDAYMVVLLCIMIGLPIFVFLNVVTNGIFILVFLSAGIIGAMGLVHYFLWGRSMDNQVAGEREEEQARAREEQDEWANDF